MPVLLRVLSPVGVVRESDEVPDNIPGAVLWGTVEPETVPVRLELQNLNYIQLHSLAWLIKGMAKSPPPPEKESQSTLALYHLAKELQPQFEEMGF